MSSHRFHEGKIYHKRYLPKEHAFTYRFWWLDVDVADLATLRNRLFGYEHFNLFGFSAKDHFGPGEDFAANVEAMAREFDVSGYDRIRFFSLPRVLGFVFNPLSALLFFREGVPIFMLAEVHNYNGGRILYPVELRASGESSEQGQAFVGTTAKDMYVSPFFESDGIYDFVLKYTSEKISVTINYSRDGERLLTAALNGKARPFSAREVARLFMRHSWLTLWVVTRTVYQSLRLRLKGIAWRSPDDRANIRRY